VFSTITHLKMSKAQTSNCWTDFCKIRWSAKDGCCHSSFRMCQYTTMFYNGMCTCICANRYYVYRCI